MLDSTDNNTLLREGLSPCVPLRFPGFEKHYQAGQTATAYAFDCIDCREWYCEMVDKITSALEHNKYLPLYRMGDGEYKFLLGADHIDLSPIWKLTFRQAARKVLNAFNGRKGHKSGSREYGFEEYTHEELIRLHEEFPDQLRVVARSGILSLALHDTPRYHPYVPRILDWFREHNIPLHRQNYYHVYSIYALMHGPDRGKLLQGRRILVVTGLTSAKRNGIEKGLYREGATNVQFLPCSLNKAMFDVLDLSLIEEPVDLVLIGAGIGAVNILVQLRPLQTVCLDVGFALSTLANPDLRWNRPFCVPDEEFDISKIEWLRR